MGVQIGNAAAGQDVPKRAIAARLAPSTSSSATTTQWPTFATLVAHPMGKLGAAPRAGQWQAFAHARRMQAVEMAVAGKARSVREALRMLGADV